MDSTVKGRLRRWLVPDPIRRQYTFKFGIVLLLLGTAIGTVGLVATGEIRQEISTDVEAEYANLAAREARNLENWHRNNRRTARSMASASDVRTGDRNQVRAYLQRQQLEGSGTITEIHYVDLDDREVVASTEGRLEGRQFEAVDRPWADVPSVGDREVVSTAAYRKGTAGAVLAYVTGVERPGGGDRMALVVTVRTAAYSNTVVDSADTHTTVVDASGRIVFAQQYETLVQYYDGGPAPPVERARDPESATGGSMRIPAPDSVRTALSLTENEEVIVGYDRVEGTDWVVLVHVPTETAFGFVDWITFVGFGATLATLLLVTGVGLVMGRDTARAIDRLTEKAAQLEAGNYDVDLSTDRIDNLGRLYEAFDSMASSLADRERTLRSQTEVLESERDRLSALFDNATGPVVRLTLEGGERVIRDANARFDRTFAPDADTPVSGPIDEAVEVPDGERSLSSLIREAPGEGVEREVVAIAGGETREFLFRWIPIGTDGGREGYAVFTDITERKERERDLKRNETVIEALGDPVYALDPEGTITFVNEAVLEATGYEESELVGNDYSMVMNEEDAERAENLVVELLESDDRSTATIEWDLRTADGDVMPVENHIALLEDDGRFRGTAGVLRDVTERKERETQLRRSEERYRTLVENSPAPIGIVTMGPTLSYANDAGIQFLGADSESSVVGTDPLQFVHPDGRELARERLLSVLEDRTVAEPIEQQFVALDGTERVATITSAPITYEGEPAVMIVLNDVTERKRHERALRSLNDAARRLLNTETEEGIAEVVADAAAAAIDVDGCAVYLLDADENRLEPVGITPGFVEVTGGTPSVTVGDEDSAVWAAYLDGEQVTVESDERTGRLPGDARAGQFLPLGDHGVFAAVSSTDGAFDEDTDRLVELLAATTEAAFDRLESEASLRDREAQLEQQNERLERQVQINRTIRDVQKKLTSASTREEVERGACEGLTDLQGFRFAWIGEQDPADEETAPEDAGTEVEAPPEGVDTDDIDLGDVAGEDADEDLVERVAESDPETVATELAALRERVDGLEAELDERDDEIEDLESELKRKQADFQNYKKRMEKRREQEKQRATEDLVERLVDVRDNLVRALDQEEEGADAEDIRGGVETTLSQFDRVLEDENVDVVDPEPGEEVDPHTHEVLMRVDSDQPEGTIDAVHRPGYVMAEKVLQTAQVTVSDGDEGDGRTRSETV